MTIGDYYITHEEINPYNGEVLVPQGRRYTIYILQTTKLHDFRYYRSWFVIVILLITVYKTVFSGLMHGSVHRYAV